MIPNRNFLKDFFVKIITRATIHVLPQSLCWFISYLFFLSPQAVSRSHCKIMSPTLQPDTSKGTNRHKSLPVRTSLESLVVGWPCTPSATLKKRCLFAFSACLFVLRVGLVSASFTNSEILYCSLNCKVHRCRIFGCTQPSAPLNKFECFGCPAGIFSPGISTNSFIRNVGDKTLRII